jgi:hypothetical protein
LPTSSIGFMCSKYAWELGGAQPAGLGAIALPLSSCQPLPARPYGSVAEFGLGGCQSCELVDGWMRAHRPARSWLTVCPQELGDAAIPPCRWDGSL